MADLHKCGCCGFVTADKLVIRDLNTDASHGWIGFEDGPEQVDSFQQRFFALLDRGKQVEKRWECQPCRIAIAKEIQEELDWLVEHGGPNFERFCSNRGW